MTAITICSDFGGSPPKIKSATLLCKKLPKCLPKWLYHFPFLPAMSECSCYSIFSPLFVFVSFMDFGHSNMCGLPKLLSGKEFACNAECLALIPVSGRSPREGNDNPFQYSCLGNPMDRATWWQQSMELQQS